MHFALFSNGADVYCVGGEKDINTHATTAYAEKFTLRVQEDSAISDR